MRRLLCLCFLQFGVSGQGQQSFEDKEPPAINRRTAGETTGRQGGALLKSATAGDTTGQERCEGASLYKVPPVEGARGERHQSNSRGRLAWSGGKTEENHCSTPGENIGG